MIEQKIYNKMPLFIQNLMITCFGYLWQKRRFGGVYPSEYIRFKDREKFNEVQWLNYQESELRKLLTYAYENVPYYHQRFNEFKITPDALEKISLSEIKNIPILEKKDLREFGGSNLLSRKRDKSLAFFHSSGSTGTPTKIGFTKKMHQTWSAAFEARIRNWAGLSIKDSRGMIGGRRVVQDGISTPPFHRYNFIEKQIYFSAYHVSLENSKHYLKAIKDNKVKYMTGYAMSNFILARFIEEAGLDAPKLNAVITSSEKLTQEMRDTFGRVYKCKTYDSYSGVEACGLISECEFGSLHISPDVGLMEIVKPDGSNAKPGEIGEVISTGFLNYEQPLIRYRIGDSVRLAESQICKCGRQMPIVSEIVGRSEDIVIGIDGREMVRFHGIFVGIMGLVEGQIVQWAKNKIEIRLVTTASYDKSQETIMANRLFSQLGDLEVKFTYVEKIDLGPNGKFKAVISHIKRSK